MFEPLQTERLVLRNWHNKDRELFYEINSDEQVMAFFPFRRTRVQSDEMMDFLSGEITKNGFGFTPVELKRTHECIGFCGLHLCSDDLNFPKGSVEIGWRLSSRYWAKGYATEAARKWLEFGFTRLNLEKIISFAVHDNHASTAVMKRIGMQAVPSLDFDHPGVPKHKEELVRHVYYEITRHDWKENLSDI